MFFSRAKSTVRIETNRVAEIRLVADSPEHLQTLKACSGKIQDPSTTAVPKDQIRFSSASIMSTKVLISSRWAIPARSLRIFKRAQAVSSFASGRLRTSFHREAFSAGDFSYRSLRTPVANLAVGHGIFHNLDKLFMRDAGGFEPEAVKTLAEIFRVIGM